MKLKGFTLIEILVNLTLSSILFGSCWLLFRIQNARANQVEKYQMGNEELSFWALRLQSDVADTHSIEPSNYSIDIVKNSGQKITYSVHGSQLVRGAPKGILDSLSFPIQKFCYTRNPDGLVDGIILEALKSDSSVCSNLIIRHPPGVEVFSSWNMTFDF